VLASLAGSQRRLVRTQSTLPDCSMSTGTGSRLLRVQQLLGWLPRDIRTAVSSSRSRNEAVKVREGEVGLGVESGGLGADGACGPLGVAEIAASAESSRHTGARGRRGRRDSAPGAPAACQREAGPCTEGRRSKGSSAAEQGARASRKTATWSGFAGGWGGGGGGPPPPRARAVRGRRRLGRGLRVGLAVRGGVVAGWQMDGRDWYRWTVAIRARQNQM
jgi:hypothetical protein